jgi:hypothetical protein
VHCVFVLQRHGTEDEDGEVLCIALTCSALLPRFVCVRARARVRACFEGSFYMIQETHRCETDRRR